MTACFSHSSSPSVAAEDLARRVRLFLDQKRIVNGALLIIEARDGVVTLRGLVETFHQRQLVIAGARRVAGVTQIVDELVVDLPLVNRPAIIRTSRPLIALASTVAAFVALAFAGCGQARTSRVATIPTKGSITYQGQPIAGAFVALHSKSAIDPKTAVNSKVGEEITVPTSTAVVQTDGSFAVTTYEAGDGVPAGDYVLTVQWRKATKSGGDYVPGPNLLPVKYSRPETSDLVIHVAAGQNELPAITLKR